MDREGTTSQASCRLAQTPALWRSVQVQFAQPHQAMAAQHDLDKKQLQGPESPDLSFESLLERSESLVCSSLISLPGMSGAFLTVEFAYPQGPAVSMHHGHSSALESFEDTPQFLPLPIRACCSTWLRRALALLRKARIKESCASGRMYITKHRNQSTPVCVMWGDVG